MTPLSDISLSIIEKMILKPFLKDLYISPIPPAITITGTLYFLITFATPKDVFLKAV